MERKFLEELGLEKETIDKVMAQNGEDINKAKASSTELEQKVEQLTTDLETANATVKNANKEIESFKSMDVASIQSAAEEWKQKYETEKTERENERLVTERNHIAEKAASSLEFTSNSARKAFMNELLQKDLPLQDGALLGFDDYVETYKESDPTAFKSEEAPAPKITLPTKGGQLPDKKVSEMSYADFQKQFEQNNQ